MQRFQNLAVASTLATFLLVTIGGLVRATKSGLGCGDNWPHCPGEVDRALLIESSHRFVAGVVVALLAGLAFVAWRSRRTAPGLLKPSLAAFGLVVMQALLGAVVVWLELAAESVVLHLATAMALLATLVYVTAASFAVEGKLAATADRRVAREASLAAASVLVLLLAGSYVTGRDAGYVFSDWPLMNGWLVPDLSVEPFAIHFLHRALAAVIGVVVLVVAVRITKRSRQLPMQARLAHVAAGAYALEVVVGAVNVWTRLNAAAVTAHLFLGVLVWSSLVAIAIVSRPALGAAGREGAVRRSEPILEAGG